MYPLSHGDGFRAGAAAGAAPLPRRMTPTAEALPVVESRRNGPGISLAPILGTRGNDDEQTAGS